MSPKSRLTASILCVLYPVLAGNVAHAQAAAAESNTLEEVIVTAQKRSERVIDVPFSISAVTGGSMQETGAAQLADFLQTAPGVGIIDNESGTQTIQIRGINSTFGNAPVGYYLDELPFSLIGNTQVPDIRTYDLERVEILRGPQGTLYGDGSIGGTIRILTRDPNLQAFQGDLDMTGSDTTDGENNTALKGMLNVPLKDDVAALRLVASREDMGGWIDNTGTGGKDENSRNVDAYRAKVRFAPTDKLDIVLSGWHTNQSATGNALSLDDRTSPDPAPEYETNYDLYSATIRYSFGAFDLVSATSMMDYTANSLTYIAGIFDFTDNTSQDLLGEELRLTSTGDGNFRWTAGVFYRSIDRKTTALLPAFGFAQDLDMDSDSWAVFGETTWSLLDRKLDLTLGLRYFEDDRKFVDADPVFGGTVEQKFDATTPRFNVAYHLSDDWMVYGNVSEGFRTGQPQPAISLRLAELFGVEIPEAIDPETMWSYEVGTKGTFAEGRVTLEAAAYYNDWKDLQVVVRVTPQVAALTNGGDARTQGLEFGITALPIDSLTLQFTAGFVDAKFVEDVAGVNIQDGDEIPGVPETTLSAAATYRWPATATLGGFAYGSAQYASERTDVVNDVPPSDATTTVDLRLGLEGKRWSGYLFADNITDEDGAIDVYASGPTGPALRFRPRTFGINLRYSFN